MWISLLILATLAGCGQPTVEKGSGLEPTNNQVTTPPTERTLITFAIYPYQKPVYRALADQFNQENAEVEVQLVEIPETPPIEESSEPVNWLKEMASLADTTLIWDQNILQSNAGDYFENLDPIVAADPNFDLQDYWPGMRDTCLNSNGGRIGVPLTGSMNGVFISPQVLESAGLPAPEPDWTWEDFQQLAGALADPNGDPPRFGYADRDYLNNSVLAPWIDQLLVQYEGNPKTEVIEEYLRWYVDAAQSGIVRPLQPTDAWDNDAWQTNWNEWTELLKSEATRPAIWVGALSDTPPDWNGNPSDTNPYKGSFLESEIFLPFPGSSQETADSTTPLYAECGVISGGSQHMREAFLWLSFLSRQWPVQSKTQIWEVSRIPARQSVATQQGFWELLPDPAESAVRYALEHAWHGGRYFQQMNAIGEAMAKSIQSGDDLRGALEAAMARIQIQPAQSSQDTSPVVVATPKPTPLPGQAEIRFYYGNYNPQELAAMKELADKFNQENPAVRVDIEDQFYGDYPDWNAALSKEFDCIYTNAPYWPGTDEMLFLPIDAFLETEPAAFKGDFDPAVLDLYRKQAVLFGLPGESQPQVMAYNADLLRKLNLAAPDSDWSFEEFVELASRIGESDQGNYYGYLASPWDDLLWFGFDVQWGEPDAIPPKANFTDPAVIHQVDWLVQTKQDGVFFFQDDTNWPDISTAIEKGELAFWTSQAGNLLNWYIQPGSQPDFDLGVLPLPRTKADDALHGWSSETGFFIFRSSKYQQGCWQWIRYLSDHPETFQGVPARVTHRQAGAWVDLVGAQNAAVYLDALSRVDREAYGAINSIGWPLYTWRSEMVQKAMDGSSPAEAAANAQSKAVRFLKCVETIDIKTVQGEELNKAVTECAKQADPDRSW
jgi:ABC-type glycerol-3-phosphate transport system substrate-binding protein